MQMMNSSYDRVDGKKRVSCILDKEMQGFRLG